MNIFRQKYLISHAYSKKISYYNAAFDYFIGDSYYIGNWFAVPCTTFSAFLLKAQDNPSVVKGLSGHYYIFSSILEIHYQPSPSVLQPEFSA